LDILQILHKCIEADPGNLAAIPRACHLTTGQAKGCWDKLVAEDQDWAYLAMHLWPERVVLKCADDRSLAIAHGLEEIFRIEGSNGKWQKRDVDAATVQKLIDERTSFAVKAALKSLLEAPAPGKGSSKTSRKLRKAREVQ
jgi:hypothetical protein